MATDDNDDDGDGATGDKVDEMATTKTMATGDNDGDGDGATVDSATGHDDNGNGR